MGYLKSLCCCLLIFLVVSCKENGASVKLILSFAEEEVSHEAGSVFLKVSSDTSWKLEIEGDALWASLNVSEGSGSKNSIILTYSANEGEEDRSLSVVARTVSGSVTSRAGFVQKAYSSEGGGGVPGVSDGGKASKAPFGWMELPATYTDDGYDFIWHCFSADGKSLRNYSYYWDYKNLVAHWVAYPLTSSYINKGAASMPYTWGLDPLLSASEQPVIYYAYSEGNNKSLSGAFYARGHQIAMADRKINREANIQTCYGTNITPQLNKSDNGGGNMDFNGAIWANLESRVRDWAASSDTLYVVTGCTLNGSQYYVYDNNGKKVTVPTGYFKAVLRYSKNSTLGHSGYMGAAFYLDHKLYSTSTKIGKSDAMSIDELENKLGMDFFVNLPSQLGEAAASAVEAENPQKVGWWW